MKKNELRIGNLVKLNGEIIEVEQITKKKIGYHKEPRENVMHYARLWEIEPIELTEDWTKEHIKHIEYIGFIVDMNIYAISSETQLIFSKGQIYRVYCINDVEEWRHGFAIKTLHDLQNWYYTITNKELEVNL